MKFRKILKEIWEKIDQYENIQRNPEIIFVQTILRKFLKKFYEENLRKLCVNCRLKFQEIVSTNYYYYFYSTKS